MSKWRSILRGAHGFFRWEPSAGFFASLRTIAPAEPDARARLLWNVCDWWLRLHTTVASICATIGTGLFGGMVLGFAEVMKPETARSHVPLWILVIFFCATGAPLLWVLCWSSLARAGSVRDRYQEYAKIL